jgi:hypothetical protein
MQKKIMKIKNKKYVKPEPANKNFKGEGTWEGDLREGSLVRGGVHLQ